MTDIQIAKANLIGHSICLCKNGTFFTDDGQGISPMMKFIREGRNLNGYSAADIIVGKAAAMLFVKAGISEVYGRIMSKAACGFLREHKTPFSYDMLTDSIINRKGDDICPMEKAVMNINDIDEAYQALDKTVKRLMPDNP